MSATPASKGPARSTLPYGWNPSRDLLVLYGTDPTGIASSLKESGQQRIFLYLPPGAEKPKTEGIPCVRSHSELMQEVQLLAGASPSQAHLRVLPGSILADHELREMSETLAKAVKSWNVNRATLDSFGRLWIRQVVANLGELATHPSVQELEDLFEDRPCVIVSPGPSLEKNVEQLRELDGRAIIMTCPHALHALEAAGVVPDIVVIGDARTLAWQYADYDFSRVSALVLMASSSRELFELPARRIYTYGFSPDVDLWPYGFLQKNGFLATGGSVACAELSLAVRMGCPEVAFVGQDLAFAGSRYYASSVRDGESTAQLSEDGESFSLHRELPVDRFNHKGRRQIRAQAQKVVEVPGYFGGTVKTSHSLSVFLDWFTVIVRSEECTSRVFNCTEGGAFIDGMMHVPLEHFRRRLPAEPLEAFDVRLERGSLAWDGLQAAERMRRSIDRIGLGLDRCQKAAETALRLARGCRGNPDKLPRLNREESKLSRELKAIPFVSAVAQAEIRAAIEAGAAASQLNESLEASERLFRVVLDAVKVVREPLREARDRLRTARVA